eukprot:jgi/Mesvir1/14251/Mv09687-RA.1
MQGVLKVQLGEEWWKPIANKLGITVTPAVEEQLASLKLERARQQAKKRDPNWRRLRKKKKTEAQGGKWKDNKAGGEYEHGSGYAIYGQPVAGQEGGGECSDSGSDSVLCTVCGGAEHKKVNPFLLCSNQDPGDHGGHMLCLGFTLSTVPGDPWFCAACDDTGANSVLD